MKVLDLGTAFADDGERLATGTVRRTARLLTHHDGTYSHGGKATSTGRGGIDYVARTRGATPIPIVGEIKVGSDKDPLYTLIQLLAYVSELCSDAQAARARSHSSKSGRFGLAARQALDWGERIRRNEFGSFYAHCALAIE